MAHFAKLGKGNIVEKVEVVANDIATTEQAGADFLNNLYKTKDVWKQTSFNTRGGKYYIFNENEKRVELSDQSKSFRKNYAGVGFTYDQTRDAFIGPQPYPSWTLNEDTCLWEAPIAKPALTQEQIDNNSDYSWNEQDQSWTLIQK